MSDVNSILNQLSKVHTQLDSSQQMSDPVAQEAMDKKAIGQLIFNLSLMCQGLEQQFNEGMVEQHEPPRKSDNLHQLVQDLMVIDTQLKRYLHRSEENRMINQELVRNSARQLQFIQGVPPELRNQLNHMLAQPNTNSIHDNRNQLAIILAFYHQALINHHAFSMAPGGQPAPQAYVPPPEPPQPTPDIIEAEEDEDEFPDEGFPEGLFDDEEELEIIEESEEETAPVYPFDEKLHQQICNSLQQLITELDFPQAIDEQLAEIRVQLLSEITPLELPDICLNIINLIVEGAQNERKEAHKFLHSLNEDLSSAHDHFSDDITKSRSLQEEQLANSHKLRKHIIQLHTDVSKSKTLPEVKSAIAQQLSHMETAFKEKARLVSEYQGLTDRLCEMEEKLRSMREETESYNKQLKTHKHQHYIDGLTQLNNRTAFDERLELEYKRRLRYENNLGIAIIDIDHFKSINDQFGHLAGDKALKIVARTLSKSTRETDFLARYGGEEFVLLMPNITEESLKVPLESLRNQVQSLPLRFKNKQINITISIGATLFNESDELLDAFERADKALYEAKSSGRNMINIVE